MKNKKWSLKQNLDAENYRTIIAMRICEKEKVSLYT